MMIQSKHLKRGLEEEYVCYRQTLLALAMKTFTFLQQNLFGFMSPSEKES